MAERNTLAELRELNVRKQKAAQDQAVPEPEAETVPPQEDVNTSLHQTTEAQRQKNTDTENSIDSETQSHKEPNPFLQQDVSAPLRSPTRRRPPGSGSVDDTDSLTLALPSELYRRVRRRALDERRPARAIMIDALIEYLDRVEGK